MNDNTPVSWADPFYLSDSLLTLAALLSFPLARRTRLERWKFLLDAAMVLIGGGVAIWYFSVRPGAASQESSLVVTLLAFAYPLTSLMVLLGVTTVLLRRPIDGNQLAFRLMVTGVSVGVVADLTFNLISLEAGTRSASWADGVFLVCYAMLICSGELYWRRPVTHQATSAVPVTADSADQSASLPRGGRNLPSATDGSVAAVERSDQRASSSEPCWSLVLVVLRQLVTVRENVRLLAEHAARHNEARFRSLVQHSSDVIIVTRIGRNSTVRESLRYPGLRLRSLRNGAPRHCRPAPSRRPGAGRHLLSHRGAVTRRQRAGRVEVPPLGRLLAACGDPGDEPAPRPIPSEGVVLNTRT